MAENWIVRGLLFILLLGMCSGVNGDDVIGNGKVGKGERFFAPTELSHGSIPQVGAKNLSPDQTIRQRLRFIYTTEIGVVEATGKNDGIRVSEYLAYVGLGPYHDWCAAFTCWAMGKADILNPKNPWSPALFPANKIVWERGDFTESERKGNKENKKARSPPKTGSVFGIYFADKKRIAHVGFVDKWGGSWVTTCEGNVDNGVFRKRRPVSTIYKVADFITD